MRAIVLAGVAAGVTSTLAEVLLWALFTDAVPDVVYRDARLAAALVLGPRVLEPAATAGARVLSVATVVHFALSVGFAAALAPLVARRSMPGAGLAGAAFGVALYVLNLHVLTTLFPWFATARGAITLAAHVVFGATAAVVYRLAR